MQTRRFSFGTREALAPALAALAIGVALFLWLTPGFGAGRSANPGVIRIYSSVPQPSYDSMVHGIELALEEVGYSAGGSKLEFVPLNGARLQPNGSVKWDPELELANARRAAEDPDAMVYIGTYNSGAAKISIPVLNRVGMAMISPGNTYPGLTKPGTGTAGEPWTYFPLGVRNYFRVVPADDLQGAAAAAYAQEIGATSVYVLDDTELYGKGIATIFAQSARDLGLDIVSDPESISIDVRATDYRNLANEIVGSKADLVYFGGITENHADMVAVALGNAGYAGAFMGPDGIANDVFIKGAQGIDESMEVYSTLVGLPGTELEGAGASWFQRYNESYPNDDNRDFAPFGYEAARVAISAINRAQAKDREAIRAAVAQTTSDDLEGEPILGDWRFDANGDTSLVTISVQRMGQQWLYEGGMSYNTESKQWSFQSK